MFTRSLASVLALAAVAACSDGSKKDVPASAAQAASSGSGAQLTGAGATFPNPLYAKWFSEYATKTGVKINYQSIGSGGGIRQLSEQTVDFGASDAPMSDEELAKAKGGAVLHIPTALGAVVVTYNLPGVAAPLKLTGEVVAAIYQGQVKRWNDARIASLNDGVALPATDILVIHRSDGSGTSFVFTDYLSKVNTAWATSPGRGKDIQWPVGLGAKGNEGVAGQVKQSPGAIGYIELAYANQCTASSWRRASRPSPQRPLRPCRDFPRRPTIGFQSSMHRAPVRTRLHHSPGSLRTRSRPTPRRASCWWTFCGGH
jgi:phosphate transport system substrate-binding protein